MPLLTSFFSPALGLLVRGSAEDCQMHLLYRLLAIKQIKGQTTLIILLPVMSLYEALPLLSLLRPQTPDLASSSLVFLHRMESRLQVRASGKDGRIADG